MLHLMQLRHSLIWLRRALIQGKYRPDQPRVPAGNPDGGQWTIDGSNGGASRSTPRHVRLANASGTSNPGVASDAPPILVTEGTQVAADGHHYVPRGVFEKEKYSFRPEALSKKC